MWKCPKCGEQIEDQFTECWACAAIKFSDEEKELVSLHVGNNQVKEIKSHRKADEQASQKQANNKLKYFVTTTKVLAIINILLLIFCGYNVYTNYINEWGSSKASNNYVCKVCGAPATQSIHYTRLIWFPGSSRSENISVPLCDKHYQKYKNSSKPPSSIGWDTFLYSFLILAFIGAMLIPLFNKEWIQNINSARTILNVTAILSMLLIFGLYYVLYILKLD